jgi:hypothetical protein
MLNLKAQERSKFMEPSKSPVRVSARGLEISTPPPITHCWPENPAAASKHSENPPMTDFFANLRNDPDGRFTELAAYLDELPRRGHDYTDEETTR